MRVTPLDRDALPFALGSVSGLRVVLLQRAKLRPQAGDVPSVHRHAARSEVESGLGTAVRDHDLLRFWRRSPETAALRALYCCRQRLEIAPDLSAFAAIETPPLVAIVSTVGLEGMGLARVAARAWTRAHMRWRRSSWPRQCTWSCTPSVVGRGSGSWRVPVHRRRWCDVGAARSWSRGPLRLRGRCQGRASWLHRFGGNGRAGRASGSRRCRFGRADVNHAPT
jgi:hypothetical protein